MNKIKRYLALAAVVLIAIVALLPLVFSLGSSQKSQEFFRMSIAMAYLFPVLVFAILLVAKHRKGKVETNRKQRDIDTVIFDVGNVLVDFDWENFLDGFQYETEKRERIADAIFRSEAWELRDKGIYTEEEIQQMFVDAAPEYKKEIQDIIEKEEMTIKEKDYARTWIQYLKKQGYKCYILSNYSETLLNKTKNKIPIEEMEGSVFSCYVKSIKPEKEIYEYLLETYKIDPKKAVFIDDREKNLEKAKEFGISTVLFKNFKQATEGLAKLGVE